MILSKRAQQLKPSPTLAIAAKARQLREQGHDVISLSVGEPDWDSFDFVKEAGIEAIRRGETKYSSANGSLPLRQAIADKTARQLSVTYGADEVTVSAGAKFILFSALQVLCDPGDEVLIPVPYWVSYPVMVELAGGRPLLVRSAMADHFKPGSKDLAAQTSDRTKILILNSPSNPSGLVYSRQELEDVAQFLREHPQVVTICDDIYNELVFGSEPLAPHLLHVAPDLKDRVIVVNGASKTYAMTGWRLGWALGPKAVISAMSNYQSQSVSCASPFTQTAGLAALQKGAAEVLEKVSALKKRRDFFVEGLSRINGLKVIPPEGAFYLWVDIRGWLGKVSGNLRLSSSADVATALLDQANLAVVPGAESGVEGYLRLSFALSEATLAKAIERFSTFTANLTTT